MRTFVFVFEEDGVGLPEVSAHVVDRFGHHLCGGGGRVWDLDVVPVEWTSIERTACIVGSLVVGVRRGRERHYHLNPHPLAELNEWLHPFERYWSDRLSDLAYILEDQ